MKRFIYLFNKTIMANFRIPLDYKEHVNRAVHNLECIKRTTCHPMTAIPLYGRRMFVGDKFYFSTPQLLLQSQPTFAPVMGTYRLRVEWYFDSDANRYGWIDNNNRLSTEEVMKRRHHTMSPLIGEYTPVDPENILDANLELIDYWQSTSVGRGSLADYMGVAPGYMTPQLIDADSGSIIPGQNAYGNVWNLDFILAYLNIIRSYHCNVQFPDIPYINNLSFDTINSGSLDSDDVFSTYSLKDLDDLFMLLRFCENGVDFPANALGASAPSWVPERYRNAYTKFSQYLYSVIQPHGGLFCTQYEPDLYRNLLSSDMDLLKSEVTTNPDGSFTIESFRFKNRLQIIYDRISSVGGRRSDIVRSRWGITSRKGYDLPELIAVQSEYIDTSLVTSSTAGSTTMADGETYSNVPGDMAGNVNQRKYPKGTQAFTANESGILMAIVTITPIVDYCQNIERYLLENNFEDEFSPQMAQKGFESVPLSDYSVMPHIGNDPIDPIQSVYGQELDTSVGKQIAWLREMTAVNRVHGEFATRGFYETWVLKRQYTTFDSANENGDVTKTVISPYGNPLEWQYPFVAQSITDPNFYLQCHFKVRGVRPIGRRYMPTLE